jgi:hypothetical protein
MKMTIRKLVLVLALLLVQPVIAQDRATINAVELSPSNIILPGTANGTMTFRPCDGDCEAEHIRARLTENTVFTIDGRKKKFDEFRREFAIIKRNSKSFALVIFATDTNTVSNIEIIS